MSEHRTVLMLDWQMCVEATVLGRHLYEKHGFRITQNVVLTVPDKWADKPRVEFAFMQRPAASTSLQK